MAWDFESLKYYLDRRFEDNEKRYTDRFEGQEKAVDTALVAQNVRLDGMNEFRKSLSDLSNRFVTTEMYSSEHKALEAKMEATTERIVEVEQTQARAQGAIIGKMNQLLIAVIVAAISVSLTFVWAHATLPTPVGK